jgi:hypothetical protein
MFIDNKYAKWYAKLCSTPYTGKDCHRHHIIPKSLGGPDTNSNIVKLSYRQHYVAHRLLMKITTGMDRSKMAFAMMRFGKTSRSFEFVSRQISEALSGNGNPMFGKKLSAEHRASITGENHGMFGTDCYKGWVAQFGKQLADEKKKAMLTKRSASLTGDKNPMFGIPRTAEQKSAQSVRMTGENHPLFGVKRHPTKWMHNASKSRMIKAEEVSVYLDAGWVFGKLPK